MFDLVSVCENAKKASKELLSLSEDVKKFASEAGIEIFFVLPPINDREPSADISKLLAKLGMVR